MSAGFTLIETPESKVQRDNHTHCLTSQSPAGPLCLK